MQAGSVSDLAQLVGFGYDPEETLAAHLKVDPKSEPVQDPTKGPPS